MLSWTEFEQVDIRVGTIVEACEFPAARRPAYQLVLDFGPEIGLKKSSAQLTQHYTPATLLGRQVLAPVVLQAHQPLRLPASLASGVYLLEIQQGTTKAVRRIEKK